MDPTGDANVAALRALVGERTARDADAGNYCDDAALQRVLRARDGRVREAHALLTNVLDWRAAHRPWEATCPLCASSGTAHSMRHVGWDAERRPVVYTSMAQCMDRHNSTANMLHLQNIVEKWGRLERMGRGSVDGKWIYIFDMQGFGMLDALDPSTGLKSCFILQKYPERLSRVFVVDAPRLFSGLWSIFRKAMDPVTAQKVVFVTRAEAGASFAAHAFPPGLVAWLTCEMADNRAAAPGNGSKRYWVPPGKDAAHDPRGAPDYVASDEYFALACEAAGQQTPRCLKSA
ncbi:CRAL-TRIO domain-containing protein [Baffinella frigidus]|nr:CRAL-TRIO domain-containing protein [Cryptophyta sp. CCMP2293]